MSCVSIIRVKPMLTLRAGDVQVYRLCDDLSGLGLLAMVIFSPWAFGTTQPWAIWVMNFVGDALGVLWLLKLLIRQAKGYVAPSWENYSSRAGALVRPVPPSVIWLRRVLAGLTVAFLLQCLLSAWNRSARYDFLSRTFQYFPHLNWLPTSLDGTRSWFYFWMYLGLAGTFWAAVDWLAGMTAAEERLWLGARAASARLVPTLPARLKLLLWVLCLNGAVLGVEAIVQRVSGSSKLLFLVLPLVNPSGTTQFGPYAYRANAALYFNLLWPVCLGFWWILSRAGGLRFQLQHLLLLAAAVMAACPIISTSRGGALVTAGILVVAMIYLIGSSVFTWADRARNGSMRWGQLGWLALFLTVTLALGRYYGWESLAPRMEQVGEGYEIREQMYAAAQPMAKDYPWLGTGPGTFASVFSLYRLSDEVYWPEQLHNDWLELRITFGWVGWSMLLAALACVAGRWFLSGGLPGSRQFVLLAWLALAGCLVHARFDFPFQIYSIVLLFLLICAILFNLSLHPGGARR